MNVNLKNRSTISYDYNISHPIYTLVRSMTMVTCYLQNHSLNICWAPIKYTVRTRGQTWDLTHGPRLLSRLGLPWRLHTGENSPSGNGALTWHRSKVTIVFRHPYSMVESCEKKKSILIKYNSLISETWSVYSNCFILWFSQVNFHFWEPGRGEASDFPAPPCA